MKQFIVMCTIVAGFFLAAAGCNTFERRFGPGLDGTPCPLQAGADQGPYPGPFPKAAPWAPETPAPPPPIGSLSKSMDPYDYLRKSNASVGYGPLVRLYPPEVVETQTSEKKNPDHLPDTFVPAKPEPPKGEEKIKPMAPAVVLPVGIPQFVQVNDKVANGLRPSLDDGLDWLVGAGFKSVLYIHEPGTSDTADRKQVEKRGMKFLTLEVSPATLTKNKLEEFSRSVASSEGMPLFVYDRDGSLAGAMWYLYFRQTQHATDEAARSQARPLGLTEDREGAHQQMWQAAQGIMKDD